MTSIFDKPEIQNTSNYKVGFILVFLFLLVGQPFVIELWPFMPGWKVLYLITFPPLILYAIKHKLPLFQKKLNKYLLIWGVIWFLYLIVHRDTVYLSRCIMVLIAVMTSSIIYKMGVERFCRYFVILLTVQAVLGTLTFFLVFFFHIPPFFEYINFDGRPGYCFLLTCTNMYSSFEELYGAFRYSGFFDEPGAMGLWGTFALLLNKLVVGSKRMEKILIVTLMFTFSLGYYAALVAYFALFYFNETIRRYKFVAIIFCLGIGYVLSTNEVVSNLFFARLRMDETTGTFAGNNRANQTELAKRYFAENPFFGLGASRVVELQKQGKDVNDNYMSPLAKEGLVGSFFQFLPFFICFFRCRHNKEALKYLAIIALTFMHREITFTNFSIIIYTLLLEVISNNFRRRKLQAVQNVIIQKNQV